MSVSVIIPFFNSEKFIDKTISSILKQTHKDFEVVCIDDGSNDQTLNILKNWSQKDKRIVVLNKENGGIETALKLGIPFLKKKYTFLIGHDDTLSIDALEKAVIEMEKDEEYDAVRMKLVIVNEDDTHNDFNDYRVVLSGIAAVGNTIMAWRIHTFCLWKTDIFKLINQITTGKLMNFDEVATRFLYTKCKKVSFCDGAYFYLQHPESVTHKFSLKTLDVFAADFYIKKLLVESKIYSDFKEKFEQHMFGRLGSMIRLYFDLKNKDFKVSKNEREKIRLLFSAIDFKYVKNKNPSIPNWKFHILYTFFPIYFLYSKIIYDKTAIFKFQ